MNTLIIYDSLFGNTKHIAEAMAKALEKHGSVQFVSAAEIETLELTGLDLLVFGCPTQIHGLTPAVRTLLDSIPSGALQGLGAMAFDTRYHMPKLLSGSAAQIIAKKLKQAGASLTLPPESFFVTAREGPLEDGELERAAHWAEKVLEQFVLASSK